MAIPKLNSRTYVENKIRTALIRGLGKLCLVTRPYRILSGQLTRALGLREGSLSDHPVFATHERVEISIIVLVSNHWAFTQACLASIEQSTAGLCYEVIVVDDGSTDQTAEMLGKIPGADPASKC